MQEMMATSKSPRCWQSGEGSRGTISPFFKMSIFANNVCSALFFNSEKAGTK